MNNKTGLITSVTAGRVRVDFNRRFAGQSLKYRFTVLEKIENDEEKVKAVVEMDYGTSEGFKVTVKEEESSSWSSRTYASTTRSGPWPSTRSSPTCARPWKVTGRARSRSTSRRTKSEPPRRRTRGARLRRGQELNSAPYLPLHVKPFTKPSHFGRVA